MIRLNDYLRSRFGSKVYKISLSANCTCPNRDGTKGTGGCIFCTGSDEFASKGTIKEQLKAAKEKVFAKEKDRKYIAYFGDHTNTYGDLKRLEKIFNEAITDKEVVALSIATRPDCLSGEVILMLERLIKIKPLFIELGLQTIHEETAKLINRCYSLSDFDIAVKTLKSIGAEVIVHMIAGLPNETPDQIVETADYIGKSGADGIKIHNLFVCRGTKLQEMYESGKAKTLSLEEYGDILISCLKVLPEKMVIHRFTGDGDKKALIAPLWSADKKKTLNFLNKLIEKEFLKI